MNIINWFQLVFGRHASSCMMSITPRWAAEKKCWVFDDSTVGLTGEPFIVGMNEIIDQILAEAGILEAAKKDGFRCEFSSQEIPTENAVLKMKKPESGGAWYRYKEMEGWLCPALLLYFRLPPPEIHVRVSL